ncbi:hypothetical protein IMSAGC011_03618 [Lachnospiraceae bacterium]|nr:hypothetical protein IMSAGC011_03618 [Lachnospiraceae bacterium]
MNNKMDRNELIELVKKILDCEGTEEEVDEMISKLEQNVIDPDISDYIYYDDLTPEQIVDKALAYKPILL